MKPRWLVLCLALTGTAVVPGLLDAQFRPGARPCPSCMQVQTITTQWQKTYNYQQQQIQQQQMQQQRIQAQQDQIRIQSQQAKMVQNRPAQVVTTQNTLQYNQAKIMKPVANQMTN